ncbi:MAG: LytTR family transcriptional regulator DNA-binding domain-containing protein [Cyclobacteriaceae bacterium]
MSKLSIYIIEDEALYANQLMMLVDELDYDLAGMADNSDTALAEIGKLAPDLLLVDIKINGTMDGIELVSSITEDKEIPAIFITSFTDKETFDRAKAVNPYAYLSKPFNAHDLQRTIELAIQSKAEQKPADWGDDIAFQGAFFIKNRHRLEKVAIADILYLEVEDRYSTVYTDQGKKYVLRMSMGDVQEKLPEKMFFRTHRKYSVNLSKIKSLDLQDNLLYLGDASVPISRTHKEELLKRLEWMQ